MPLHPAGRGRQRAARDIVERSARLDHRLLSDHAFALHLVAGAAAVGDRPFAADQLDGAARTILDPDVIGPEPAAATRLGLLGQEADGDPDGDVTGRGAMRKEAFHKRFPLLIGRTRQLLARPRPIREGACMAQDWTPASWRAREARHQPVYGDPAALDAVLRELAAYPPLVPAVEAHQLKAALAEAQSGRAFLLQGGDCAESFAEFSTETIRDTVGLIDSMARRLQAASGLRIVRVGRMAGQFAKPRSREVEHKDGLDLPIYRGDIVNGIAFDEAARRPDPERMFRAYGQSAATLSHLRALAGSEP